MRPIASGVLDLQAFSRSLACFLYCSRLGRAGSCLVHYKLPFMLRLESARDQAERRFEVVVDTKVGTALSADWMRPSRWRIP